MIINKPYNIEADIIIQAIKRFNNNPEGLENFELYLSMHLAGWLKQYASTPEGLASELKAFSSIGLKEDQDEQRF